MTSEYLLFEVFNHFGKNTRQVGMTRVADFVSYGYKIIIRPEYDNWKLTIINCQDDDETLFFTKSPDYYPIYLDIIAHKQDCLNNVQDGITLVMHGSIIELPLEHQKARMIAAVWVKILELFSTGKYCCEINGFLFKELTNSLSSKE